MTPEEITKLQEIKTQNQKNGSDQHHERIIGTEERAKIIEAIEELQIDHFKPRQLEVKGMATEEIGYVLTRMESVEQWNGNSDNRIFEYNP